MDGDVPDGNGERTIDSTGDPYEDYPEDQGEALQGSQLVEVVSAIKEFGNKAFKAGDLQLGLEKYQKGLRYLNEYSEPGQDDVAPALRFTLHSNSALLQVKLQNFEGAHSSASKALEVPSTSDADKAKAYYRRALASEGLKDDEAAEKDLQQAAKLAPGDAAVTKELAVVKKRAADQAKKEKAAAMKFFR